jgi:hypothetical protein
MYIAWSEDSAAPRPLRLCVKNNYLVGVRVEKMKNESDPISNETNRARSCRCRPVSVDRSIAVSREGCLCAVLGT